MIQLSGITKNILKTIFTPKLLSVRKFSNSVYLSTSTNCILPEPPLPPSKELILNALGEPTLSSLGLNSYWPWGWYQCMLETLHVHLELPWWGAIAATTIAIRLCVFPIIIRQRRHLANFTDNMPQFTILQERMTRARLSGNYIEVMRASQEMNELMKNNDLNPLKSLKYMFLQVPIFLSVFTGIRGLVNLPVTSMQSGGIAWFTDLTASDPYYILPFLSMSTLLLVFETGAETPSPHIQPVVRTVMRVFPIIGFVFVVNMPSALVWYWTVSNMLSFLQSLILRYPPFRSYFNLPPVRAPLSVVNKKRGFIAGFKESLNNSRLIAELESRERIDAKAWQNSGRKAIPATFISNPTKPTSGFEKRCSIK
ncbi:Mitochondrial inner membrane protein OXA1L [Schistosoma japonicum]|uniref:Preprotein translocase YidC subunit n=2 Tax=Schistosoma japonicum TaxID=6182 RepID=C1L4M5_SCHJA|nr:Mitochondrial inner membrane protein OXA1L [Schistosoma japonicum]KAH8854555.1 Mitochondrial inner membrane protein OXA1L [Schistosoma japonicum]CAX69653.1 preprotein translocase YidC subunit [Schistosoma japonicum]